MAVIQLPATSAAAPAARPRQRFVVEARKKWSGAWRPVKYLQPLTALSGASPTMPHATFRWLAGQIRYADTTAAAPYRPLDLRDQFVRVRELPQAAGQGARTVWVGRVTDTAHARRGTARGPTGEQTITAHGLQHELDCDTVRGSFVTNDGAKGFRVLTPLVFNERYAKGFREIGNRSLNQVDIAVTYYDGGLGRDVTVHRTAYALGNTPDATSKKVPPWTAQQIIEHLLAVYGPQDLRVTLGGQTAALQGYVVPRLATAGRTVYQLLNELIDRRRGLGWELRAHDNGRVEVYVFTTFGNDITYDQTTIQGNGDQAAIDLDALGHAPADVQVTVDSLARYGSVFVTGEPLVVCFSVSSQDETLVPAWSSDAEAAYKAAVGGAAKLNDAERATEKFRHVFTTFKIPKAWNWMAGDGTGGTRQVASPAVLSDGTIETRVGAPSAARDWGQTLLRHLPIPDDSARADIGDPEPYAPEYRKPFVLIREPPAASGGSGGGASAAPTYHFADNPSNPADPGAHLRMLDTELGFELRFSPAHVLALNHWAGAASSVTQPKYDHAPMIATVAARTDECLVVTCPIPGFVSNRVLQIHVPDAETWLILNGTVTDLDKGQLKRQQGQGLYTILRDDSPYLREIAALAREWHARDRAVVNLTVREVSPAWHVGQFITKVGDRYGSQAVNSVVTQVSYDFEAQTTTIQTNYGELDFAGGIRPAHKTLT